MSDTMHPSDSRATTDDLVRSLVAEHRRTRSHNILPELAPPDEPTATSKRPWHGRGNPLARLRGVRPGPRHLAWAALGLTALIYPLLFPLLVILTALVVGIVYLTLGPDRIAELLASGWDRLARRRPDLAERLRQRADRFAMRFDALLKHLPDSWAEALALPDLSGGDLRRGADDKRPDPFDRLRPPADVYRG